MKCKSGSSWMRSWRTAFPHCNMRLSYEELLLVRLAPRYTCTKRQLIKNIATHMRPLRLCLTSMWTESVSELVQIIYCAPRHRRNPTSIPAHRSRPGQLAQHHSGLGSPAVVFFNSSTPRRVARLPKLPPLDNDWTRNAKLSSVEIKGP